jgi:hypothetical protein
VAKARKSARKTGGGSRKAAVKASRKKASGKTKTAKKRASASKNELNFGPLKKQLKAHVEKLSASRSSDPRVQNALSSLQRLQAELTQECTPTMTIPLA